MELPHFTLYLRRLTAQPPGLGWREQLRTPRLQLWLQLYVWAALCLLVPVLLEHWEVLYQLLSFDTEDSTFCLLVLGACFLLYPATQQAALLGQTAHSAPGGSSGDLDWYATPLPSWNALLGICCAAVLAMLPGLVGYGLLIFTVAANSAGWSAGELRVDALRLINVLGTFILIASCLAPALRKAWGRVLWPHLLIAVAASGIGSTLIQSPWQDGFRFDSLPAIEQWRQSILLSLPLAFALAACCAVLLVETARRAPLRPLLLLGGGILAAALLCALHFDSYLGIFHELLHSYLGIGRSGRTFESIAPLLALTDPFQVNSDLELVPLAYYAKYLGALPGFWYAAVACLEAARGRQPWFRLRPARARLAPAGPAAVAAPPAAE
jgi:hypothetical protein